MNDDLQLSLHRVDVVTELPEGVLELQLRTSRGAIAALFHPCEGGAAAVIWIGGATGGMNGPAGGLYADIAHRLRRLRISSIRLNYRMPNQLEECVLDVLAAVSFLKGIGASKAIVVGHSFGGAVAIMAGTLHPMIAAVAALSSQRFGTQGVSRLAPKALLLIHGDADSVLPPQASQDIFERAGEPRRLIILPGADHGLQEVSAEVRAILWEWIQTQVGPGSTFEEDFERSAGGWHKLFAGPAGEIRELALTESSITEVTADGVVCPSNDQLLLIGAVGRALAVQGGPALQSEALGRAPAEIGDAVATSPHGLAARALIHAVTTSVHLGFPPPTDTIIHSATANALKLADKLGLRSIVFPALGTGGGGVAAEKAARLMLDVIQPALASSTSLEKVIISLQPNPVYRAFVAEMQTRFDGV